MKDKKSNCRWQFQENGNKFLTRNYYLIQEKYPLNVFNSNHSP